MYTEHTCINVFRKTAQLWVWLLVLLYNSSIKNMLILSNLHFLSKVCNKILKRRRNYLLLFCEDALNSHLRQW